MTILKEDFSLKFFLKPVGTFIESFLAFVENDLTVLLKLPSTCPEKHFEESVF